MSRLATSLAALVAVMSAPALAADWADDFGSFGDFRGAYTNEPKDWSTLGDQDDSIAIETGIRYWYSWGEHKFGVWGGEVSSTDNTHTGEAFLRVDDHVSRTYAKGLAGYSAAINGTYSVPFLPGGATTGGEVGYAGGDFGWNVLGDGQGSGLGGFIGYQYWMDSPRTARDNYATVESSEDIAYNKDTGVWSIGMDGVERHVDVHMLRLGISGKAKLGDLFDISAEVAAVPYAHISGRMGATDNGNPIPGGSGCGLAPAPCTPVNFTASPISITGTGYGGMGEVMLGFTPMENLKFRVGGRAWYLEGNYDMTFRGVSITPPQRQPDVDDPNSDDPAVKIPPTPLYGAPSATFEDYIDTNNPFSLFRYGLMAEMTYSF